MSGACAHQDPLFIYALIVFAAAAAFQCSWAIYDLCSSKPFVWDELAPSREQAKTALTVLALVIFYFVLFAGLLTSFIDRLC